MYHRDALNPSLLELDNSEIYTASLALPFPKRQILDSSKQEEFADDNFKLDENGRKLSKWVENTVGKG